MKVKGESEVAQSCEQPPITFARWSVLSSTNSVGGVALYPRYCFLCLQGPLRPSCCQCHWLCSLPWCPASLSCRLCCHRGGHWQEGVRVGPAPQRPGLLSLTPLLLSVLWTRGSAPTAREPGCCSLALPSLCVPVQPALNVQTCRIFHHTGVLTRGTFAELQMLYWV